MDEIHFLNEKKKENNSNIALLLGFLDILFYEYRCRMDMDSTEITM